MWHQIIDDEKTNFNWLKFIFTNQIQLLMEKVEDEKIENWCCGTENNEQCSEPAKLKMTDDDSLWCFYCAKNLRRVGGVECVLEVMTTPLKQRSWREEPHLWKADWDIDKILKNLNDKDKQIMLRELKRVKKDSQ